MLTPILGNFVNFFYASRYDVAPSVLMFLRPVPSGLAGTILANHLANFFLVKSSNLSSSLRACAMMRYAQRVCRCSLRPSAYDIALFAATGHYKVCPPPLVSLQPTPTSFTRPPLTPVTCSPPLPPLLVRGDFFYRSANFTEPNAILSFQFHLAFKGAV